jgi:hypothetical protein
MDAGAAGGADLRLVGSSGLGALSGGPPLPGECTAWERGVAIELRIRRSVPERSPDFLQQALQLRIQEFNQKPRILIVRTTPLEMLQDLAAQLRIHPCQKPLERIRIELWEHVLPFVRLQPKSLFGNREPKFERFGTAHYDSVLMLTAVQHDGCANAEKTCSDSSHLLPGSRS